MTGKKLGIIKAKHESDIKKANVHPSPSQHTRTHQTYGDVV